ncbi:MAG: helix-turn-helix domain-containing protein [Proteobacteria bacterium]|nr:helix-turn-helix domain-containing protein [Pseudomonadota bacterium]MDA1033839.1 helix-turn-helix domain-containing protein [Pseudomonadota bacterium]
MGRSIDKISWSTRDVSAREQYDNWVATLNQTFGTWHPEFPNARGFFADVKASKLPGMALVECKCDPCGAQRTRKDTRAIHEEQLTIQLVLSGREYIQSGDQEASLSKGDVFVWDDTQPMRFSVIEPFHKMSLVLPLERLRDWVPNEWRELPRHLRNGEPSATMLGSFLRSLSEIDFENNPMRYNALIEAAIAILVAPVAKKNTNKSLRLAQLETIKAKIQPMLRDPDLDLDIIAAKNRISLRYLHWLFEASDTTPWRYIVQQRLEGCKRDLQNSEHSNRSVTDIAFSWGFSNSAHFARRIKAEYGYSPTELRRMAYESLDA